MLCCYSRWFSGSGLPLVFLFSKGKIVRNCTHRESDDILIVFQFQLRVKKRGSESFLSDLLQPLLDQVILVFSNEKRCIAWLSLNWILERSWVALYSVVCVSVRHRCHPTKCPLFPIYTGIQALCWPNTIYKGIKALFWVTQSILGLVLYTERRCGPTWWRRSSM